MGLPLGFTHTAAHMAANTWPISSRVEVGTQLLEGWLKDLGTLRFRTIGPFKCSASIKPDLRQGAKRLRSVHLALLPGSFSPN